MFLNSDKVGKKMLFEGSNCCDEYEWDDLLESITGLMGSITEWYAESRNFGWQKLNGFATFNATNGRELLRKILPDTECNFKVCRYGRKGIAINNAHHDSPTWNEWYYITPMTKEIRARVL